MKTLNLVYFLLLILTLISGCRRVEEGCPPDEYSIDKLSNEDKSTVRYTGLDTLKFIRTELGDTLIFIGTGKDTGFTDQHYNLDYECPNGHAQLEYVNFKFVNSTLPALIELELYKKGHRDLSYISVEFKQYKFEPSVGSLRTLPYTFDSIKIQGSNFLNVQKIYPIGTIGTNPTYMLFNKFDGIVQLNISQILNLELLK